MSGERETHTCINGQSNKAQLHGFATAMTSETQHNNHPFTLARGELITKPQRVYNNKLN